jgi:polyisoprenoid-binding protein YceI
MRRNAGVSFLLLVILGMVACGGQTAESPAAPSAVSESQTGVETAVTPTGAMRIFAIMPEASEVSYRVQEEFFDGAVMRLGKLLGLTETVGKTNQIEGEVQLDLNQTNPLVAGDFAVNISALTSDDRRRDQRIREQWLESNAFPIARFRATGVEGFPASYQEGEVVAFTLHGEMTIRTVTQPVVFDVSAQLAGDTLTGSAVTRLRMSDFGFEPPSMAGLFTVADEVTVTVTFTARER